MRVLIISDIHANLAALETVLTAAAGRYDTVWCLGDVIGYGPQPNECAEIVAEIADLCVIGNHDWAILGRPGINVEDFNPQARKAVLWTQEQLSDSSRAYLEQLATEPVSPADAPDFLITHASPREPVWEYILTPTTAMENFARFDQKYCLVGHTHKPTIFRWQLHALPAETESPTSSKGTEPTYVATVQQLQPLPGERLDLMPDAPHCLILNPGSVGQPRDNDARAAFVILDLASMVWHYERVAYPIELTQSQMRAAGLPKRLIDRLSFGW